MTEDAVKVQLEVSRQLGVIQGLLMQEEAAHEAIVQKLNAMHERLEYQSGKVDSLIMVKAAPDEPSAAEDVSTVVRIIRRRAAVAAAVAGVLGAITGGAAGADIMRALQKLVGIIGGGNG